MNTYLMKIHRKHLNPETFCIEAENKQDAIEKGKTFAKNSKRFQNRDDDYFAGAAFDFDSVEVVKKINTKKKSKNKTIQK